MPWHAVWRLLLRRGQRNLAALFSDFTFKYVQSSHVPGATRIGCGRVGVDLKI